MVGVNEFENIPINDNETKEFDDDVYKKWFRTKDKSGFLSLRTWLEAGKASIDIGETTANGVRNTQVWTNAVELAVYLRAVNNGTAKSLFPAKNNTPTETFMYYGGGDLEGSPISRILKVEYWSTGSGENKKYYEDSFAWKGGHFKARKADSGAFIPDMSQPISQNIIKVSRLEMAEMSYRLDLAIHAFAARENDAFKALNGNRR